MASVFEACMVICFGVSWPLSIIRSYRARTAKGKSPLFLAFITVGYVCGIISKVSGGVLNYVLVLYCVNLTMLLIELVLYARNSRLDRQAEAAKR